MLRGLILLVLLSLAALLILPFLVSSLYIDQRGITIPGHVYSKREDVTVHYTDMHRSSEITVEYTKPDGTGVSFLTACLSPADYDGMRVGQNVSLRYLRPEDVPDLPLAKALRGAQLLPTVRLATQETFSTFRLLLTTQMTLLLTGIGGGILLLLVWRIARVPVLGWVFGMYVASGIVALLVSEFPRPMPAPTLEVRQGTGIVKSVARINRLFNGSRSKGVPADQPIEVIGVEFTPDGRTESVLMIDLIDAGSVRGLKEKSSVRLDYESQSPRTAYIRGATRTFPSRNLAGVGLQGVACLLAVVVVLGGVQLLGRAYKRLTASP
ncbi:MAG: hypothetical protein JWP08_1093 [Bryobacterales bacterium]|nr:hypothetical protein [Bryobacterales bacterium]